MQASHAQHGIWLAEQTGRAGAAYHMPLAVALDGELDVAALRVACAALADRHEPLRSRFEERAGALHALPAATPPPSTTNGSQRERTRRERTRRERTRTRRRRTLRWTLRRAWRSWSGRRSAAPSTSVPGRCAGSPW
ncbi:condensation domain-containing protein [Nonomuraea antimicrobica]